MSKCVFAVAVLAGTLSTAALAGPVTQEESQYCDYDYRQYCNQDGLEPTAGALHEGSRQGALRPVHSSVD